ncbi:MAG: hypothetical protein Q3996_02625, partial [Candidatus Saccharibacteria bacterium]|nr:hypothetical protein [Candidatus Saccharibacteria bacterium]
MEERGMQIVVCGHNLLAGSIIQETLEDIFGETFDYEFVYSGPTVFDSLFLTSDRMAIDDCLEMVGYAKARCVFDQYAKIKMPDIVISLREMIINDCYQINCLIKDLSGGYYNNQSFLVVLSNEALAALRYMSDFKNADIDSPVLVFESSGAKMTIDPEKDLLEYLTYDVISTADLYRQVVQSAIAGA